MRALRLLLFSDELALIDENARKLLKGHEYQIFDDDDLTTALARREQASGLQIDIASVDHLERTIATRTELGRVYDAYSLYSQRVFELGKSLLDWARRIRRVPHAAVSGLRLSELPIVVMNPLNLVRIEDPRSGELGELLQLPHVSAARAGEAFADCLARALVEWHAELLSELEYLGYGITLDEQGRWHVDAVFRRPKGDSPFFAAPPKLSALSESSIFRVSRDVVVVERALAALETALNESERAPPKKREPLLQRCLEAHPELVMQGMFETIWAEPNLPSADPLRHGVRPDLVVAPAREWEHTLQPRIYELKSPEFRTAIARKASKELLDALEQLGDRYRRYFADPRNQAAQREKLGRVLERPRLMLLIGRERWKQDWLDLHDMRQHSEHDHVRILSYDDLGQESAQRLELLRRLEFRTRGA